MSLSAIRCLASDTLHLLIPSPPVPPSTQQHSVPVSSSSSTLILDSWCAKPSSVAAVLRNVEAEGDSPRSDGTGDLGGGASVSVCVPCSGEGERESDRVKLCERGEEGTEDVPSECRLLIVLSHGH